MPYCNNSIDAKRLESVEVEIKARGGDCLSVAGDIGADDFPKKIVDATVQCVPHSTTHSGPFICNLHHFLHLENGAKLTTSWTTPGSHTTRHYMQCQTTLSILLWRYMSELHSVSSVKLLPTSVLRYIIKIILLSPLLCSRSSCHMNLAWKTWKPLNHQCIFYFRSAWNSWSSQLCHCQGCCTRIEQDYCKGMGPFWCSCQHRCIRLNPYPVRISSIFPFYFELMYIYTFQSLSKSIEAGATIEIDGKKIALGVPGVQRPVDTTQAREDYPLIPLRRGGTPEDAASSVLLYVSYLITWKKMLLNFNICPQLGLHSCFVCLRAYSRSYGWCWYLR